MDYWYIKSLLDDEAAIWPFAVFFKAKCFDLKRQNKEFSPCGTSRRAILKIYIYKKKVWFFPPAQSTFCVVYPCSRRWQDGLSVSTVDGAGQEAELLDHKHRSLQWEASLHRALRTEVADLALETPKSSFHRWSWQHDGNMSLQSDMHSWHGLTPVHTPSALMWSRLDWIFPKETQQLTCGCFLVSKVVSNLLLSRHTTELKVTLELKSVHQSVGQWSASQVQADLALLGQSVDDQRLKLGVVDAGLSEGSSIAILLPVVVPVSLLVSTKPKHRHLDPDIKFRLPYCTRTHRYK